GFAPAGTLLSFSVEAGSRATIAEWDAATCQELRWTTLPDPYQCAVTHTHWSVAPDGRTVARVQGAIYLRNLATGKELKIDAGGKVNDGRAIAFTPDGKALAAIVSTGDGYAVRLWDVARARKIRDLLPSLGDDGDWRRPDALVFAGDGRTLVLTASN